MAGQQQTPARIGRLAPSPTGAQHVGNARTYLIAWLSIRSRQGQIRLRIEDIDSPRIKAGATEQISTDLHWLGLDWEGEVLQQTQRLRLYQQALDQLAERDLIYPCTCTRSDVERAASAPHQDQEGPVYPGTCSGRRAGDAHSLGDQPYCWRFRVGQTIPTFVDRLRGNQCLNRDQIGGDFVIWKASRGQHPATPAYQLAVVVDDHAQKITEVVRGDDLIPSTPRQLFLYEALGWKPPEFCHVPLVIGEDGRRLAKRHGDTRLSSLAQSGVRPESFLGLLAWSCGWIGKPEPITAPDLIPLFRLETIPLTPFVLTNSLLASIGHRP